MFLVFIFTVFFGKLKSDSIQIILGNLKNYSILIVDEASAFIQNNEIEKFQSFASLKANYLNIRITYVDIDGKVLVDTDEKPQYMENHLLRPEIKKALSGENNYTIRKSNTLNKNMIYYAESIKISGSIKGVLRVSIFIDDVEKMVDSFKINYIIIIVFLVMISIFSILLYILN
jgi:two-component system, OmpR family, phosphate regulon sensor histidine kinase PhoR